MYPRPHKKNNGTRISHIFLGVSLVVLIGVIVFGMLMVHTDGQVFKNLTGDSSSDPFGRSGIFLGK